MGNKYLTPCRTLAMDELLYLSQVSHEFVLKGQSPTCTIEKAMIM